VGHAHRVEDAGAAGGGGGQVGVAVEVDQAEVVAMAREAGHHPKGDGAVAAEHQGPLPAVQGGVDAVGDPAGHLDDAVQVALPRVGRAGLVAGGGQVAVVLHLQPGRAQSLDQARPAGAPGAPSPGQARGCRRWSGRR
jgi:hypothetical protein